MAEQAFFQFGTNALEVSEEVRRALGRLQRSFVRSRAQLSGELMSLQTGALNTQVQSAIDQLNRLKAVHASLQAQMAGGVGGVQVGGRGSLAGAVSNLRAATREVAQQGGHRQANQVLKRRYRDAQRQLNERLANQLEANVDQAGRIRDPRGARMISGSMAYAEGQYFPMTREGGRRQVQTPLRSDRPEHAVDLQQAQQKRVQLIETENARQQRETERKAAQAQKEAVARQRMQQQMDQAHAARERELGREKTRYGARRHPTEAQRLAEEGQAFAPREAERKRQAQESRQVHRRELQVRRNRIKAEQQREAERQARHQREMAQRALARERAGTATRIGTGSQIAQFTPIRSNVPGIAGADPMRAQIQQIDSHGRAHQLSGDQLQKARIRLKAQNDRLEAATQRHAQAEAKAAEAANRQAQEMRTQAARRLRGIPGGGGVGGGGTRGGMGGPIGGGDGVFTGEGLFAHGQRYARYAVVAAAIFGVMAAIRDTWKEAQHLEEATTDLEVALGRGSEVSREFSGELMEVARIAGTNVGQAMESAARGVRAFSDSMDDMEGREEAGTSVAEAAERLSVIADKDIEDATGDIIAIGTSYELVAGQLGRVNEAIANAKRLGGFPTEVSQGLSSAAQAFEQAGFQLEEGASTIGVVQARLDQSGRTTASRLARVFQESRGGEAQALLQNLGVDTGGSMRNQIDQLANLVNNGELAERQINAIVEAMAGTRASREFLALLQNWDAIQQNVTQTVLEGGKATDEFNRRVDNLAGLLRRIKGSLTGIQTGLIESGFFAPIGVFLELVEPSLRALNLLLQQLNKLPDSLTTAISLMGQFAVAWRVVGRLAASRMVTQGMGAAIPGERLLGQRGANALRARGAAVAMQREPAAAASAGITQQAVARQRHMQAVARETGVIHNNTAAMQSNAAATTASSARQDANMTRRARATAAVRGQTTALMDQVRAYRTLAAESGRAHAAGVMAGRAGPGLRRGGQRALGAARGVAGSPLARGVGGMVAISAVMGAIDSFQKVARAGESAAQALDDFRNAADADALQEAARQFSTAGSEFRDAGSGMSGFFQGLFRQRQSGGLGSITGERSTEGFLGGLGEMLGTAIPGLLGLKEGLEAIPGVDFGDAPKQAAEDMERAAFEALLLSDRLEDAREEAARAGEAGVFGGVIKSVDDLNAGLEALDKQAKTASEKLEVLFAALEQYEEFGGETGVVAAGGGEQLGAALADKTFNVLEDVLARSEREHFSDIDFEGDFDITQEQAKEYFKALEGGARDVEDIMRDWRDELEEAGHTEEEARDMARERAKRAGNAAAAERRARQEAVREIEDLLPDEAESIDISRMIIDSTVAAITTAGLEEGGQLDPEEVKNLATTVVDDMISGLSGDAAEEAEDNREKLVKRTREALEGLTNLDELPEDIKNELSNVMPQMAQEAGGNVETLQRDAVAGAQERLETLKDFADLFGDDIPRWLKVALAEATQDLEDAVDQEMQQKLELAQALLPEGDLAGRTQLQIDELERRLKVAKREDDEPAQRQIEAELAEKRRDQAQERRDRAAAQDELAAGHDEVAQAAAELDAAQRELDATERLDSAGEVSEAWAEAKKEEQDKKLAYDRAEANRARAIAGAQIDPRDTLAQTRADLDEAIRLLEAEARATEEGNRSDEYWQKRREVNELRLQEAREMAGIEQARRRAGIDPRNAMAEAVEDVKSAREDVALEMEGSEAYWDAIRELREAQQSQAELESEMASARRRANIDPRSTVDNAKADLIDAREDLALAHPGDPEYHELQREVAEAELDLAETRRERASAAREAQTFPGASLAEAENELADAKAELDAAKPNEEGYYKALSDYRQAQWDLSEAAAERAAERRKLGLDITDDVVMAREELQQARERLQRLRAAGAPQELLDEQRNAIRESEAQAEQAAFQQRMRDARVAEELGQMSHQAYISFLNSEAERLRSIADRTRQQQEMLDEVDQALQQAGQQMADQFNLGDIDIPTPFEVRRAMEQRSQGLGFGQMNRTEVVNNETNVQINGADLVEVKSMLKELLGAGAMSRTSVGVGRRV